LESGLLLSAQFGLNTMNQNAVKSGSKPAPPNGSSEKLNQKLQDLLDEARTIAESDERRNRDRFPIPYTFRLTPLDHDGNMLTEEMTTVVGKDLSLTGIGFSHDHPLAYRRAIISLIHPMIGRFAVEAEVVWTRPTPIGLYESGCRLVRTVDGHILRAKA
jgi:PilZ domain